MGSGFDEQDYLACCGSTNFAKLMASSSPFSSYQHALEAARDVWFNKVDVCGWLEAFSAHPQIGQTPSAQHGNQTSAQWSKGEQSTALATATDSTFQELLEWNGRYREKFGFVFLICASGRSTPEILAALKQRFLNRPIVEFELAAQEQMKITELRLAKLFQTSSEAALLKEERVSIIGGHLTATPEAPKAIKSETSTRTRPPITTHVLDVSRGCPASGIEVRLEKWSGNHPRPVFEEADIGGWVLQGSSITNNDGRSGQLMGIVDSVKPGIYKISFNTGKYCAGGFFPYVSIVFEIRESQKLEHFHVPLLFSPFAFSTYRGS